MTVEQKIWPQTEVASHLDEILQLAANGEPQQIVRSDGVTLVIQTRSQETAVTPAIAAFRSVPRGAELLIERPSDPPRETEL